MQESKSLLRFGLCIGPKRCLHSYRTPARITSSCCRHCGNTKIMIEIQFSSRHVSIQLLTCSRLSLFPPLPTTEFHIGGIWLKCSTCRVTLLGAPDTSSQAVLSMKVTAMKGLFFIFAMLGVALQGCGCNEDGMNTCSAANTITDCASAEAAMKCIPDNGCCDFEVDVSGAKVKARDAINLVIAAMSAAGCSITSGC